MSTVTTSARKFLVTVTYNGLPKSFEVEPHAAIQSLLQHAIHTFGITQQPQAFALFGSAGELANQSSIEAAGVKKGDVLILRPTTVRGGKQ